MVDRHQGLRQLIELLRRPLFVYTRNLRNDRKGSPKAVENALNTIELLILAWAKPRLDKLPEEVTDAWTEPSP
jgi:hypothetical protein